MLPPPANVLSGLAASHSFGVHAAERQQGPFVQQNAEDRLAWGGFFKLHLAAVFLGDVLREGEAEAGAVLFIGADKGLEERVANRSGYASSAVADADA